MKKERGKGRFSRVISIIAFLWILYNNIQCISEYYVSPTETTDGDCSSSTPCSLSYAISEASVNAETTTTYIYLLNGLYQQNNNIIIKNFKDITISGNAYDGACLWTTSSNSSVFSVESSSIRLNYLTFNSSISTPLLVDENSYVIINYCVFENNTANSNSIGGGAIYSLSPLIISSSTFSNNYIGIDQSIYYSSLNKTKIYSPIALKGGAIFGNASINLLDTYFFGNYICGSLDEAHGGAIYGGYLIRLQHCHFDQNSISGEINSAYGGAIYSENSFLTILNSSFIGNQMRIYIATNADEYPILLGMGGSVYAKGKISMEFTEISQSSINFNFYYGFARVEGGAVYSEDQISISDSSFKSNYIDLECSESKDKEHHNAMGYGAVVSSSSHVKMEIIRSTFYQNHVMIRAFELNGPRYVDAEGGALQFYFGEIINSTFEGNSVVGEINDLASGSSLTGGAIGSSIVNIENCLFKENSANSTGGAVQIWNNSNETSTIINTNFILNSAFGIEKNNGGGGRGGAIASVDDHNNSATILLSLQYCSYTDNFAVNGADVYLQNIGYEIVDSGSVNIQTVDSVFYNPSTSVSKSPSFSITPSASPSYSRAIEKSDINNNNNDSNLIIVMSVSSILGVFVVVVLIAAVIAAISIFKIRQQNKKVTRRMIGDDNYVDDHEL